MKSSSSATKNMSQKSQQSTLPHLAKMRVAVLCPTRELATQGFEVFKKIGQFCPDLTVCLATGGMSLANQAKELRLRPDIVVATPGRLIDHLRNTTGVSMDDIEILVIDEADRMLQEGFQDELNELITFCPKSRQTLLFSATMTDDVDQLVRLSLNKPLRLFMDDAGSTAHNLIQEFIRIRPASENCRGGILLSLLNRTFTQRVIVFFSSKKEAHFFKIACQLIYGLPVCELHGDLTQSQRLHELNRFKLQQCEYLFATDLASRGLDIPGVQTVNFILSFPSFLLMDINNFVK